MAAEESLVHLLHLFDSFWFEPQISKKTPEIIFESKDDEQPKLAPISTSHEANELTLTSSEESLSSGGSDDFLSPNSVLRSANKLQTVFSGKDSGEEKQEEEKKKVVNSSERISNNSRRRKRKGKGLGSTKSLSELEFEELKGFMDLGFVFSEEDKNSKLAEIIPGLQRFGEEEKKKISSDNSVAAATSRRPYLSQAWENMEYGRKTPEKKVEVKINIDNEMEMKHQLKFWAHTVASTVK